MTANDHPSPGAAPSLPAAAAALEAIDEAVRTARTTGTAAARSRRDHCAPEPDRQDRVADRAEALAALLLLRQLREQLADWEPGLIETARQAGASWADLAAPLGVASRQAAERRYLRLRPGAPGTTGEQRVRATRDRRAADRTVATWARGNAADLRQLAGQIAGLADPPPGAHALIARLAVALAEDDPALLVSPLAEAPPHLRATHPQLATRVDSLVRQTDRLRRENAERRRFP
ncbi:type III effector protein [Streptomyces sp. ICBB 8177]|uniref:type III effector protein n=1 Tax=Streptomyces sp. ICBB 8177 TaxID=563922 RepID=UPI000D6792E1|nr:type III effector protein [Streptomyces sp. ICBB 8177]PWI41953.1 type III effector protein [Streptomyces sp. ICBB 8177]